MGRGSEAQDAIFLEAEKLGIDIRSDRPVPLEEKGAMTFSFFPSDDAAVPPGDDGSGGGRGGNMLFGFFDSPDVVPEVSALGGVVGQLGWPAVEPRELPLEQMYTWVEIMDFASKFCRQK